MSPRQRNTLHLCLVLGVIFLLGILAINAIPYAYEIEMDCDTGNLKMDPVVLEEGYYYDEFVIANNNLT